MNSKTIVIFAGVLMLTLFALGTGFMLAGGPSSFDCPGFHSRFHGEGFRGRFTECFDEKMALLNLTDEQKKQFETMKTQFLEEFSGFRKERKAFFSEIGNEMKKENTDIHRVADLIKTKLDRFPEVVGAHMDRMLAFYDMLDKEQQQQVLEGIRKRMESRKWHRESDEG